MSDKCYRFSSRDDTSFRCGCGEGSGLPIVTAEDDGKVLGVSNGQWIAGEFGNGGSSCDCQGLPPTKSSDIFSESFSTNDLISMGTMYGMTYHYETQLDTSDYILTDGNQYVVTFNGTDYTLTATAASGTHAYLGELNSGTLAIIYDNYPFWIAERDDHKLEVWVPEEENCSVEIKSIIIKNNNLLATKDGEWVAINNGYFDFRPVLATGSTEITFNDFKEMLDSGVIPWFMVANNGSEVGPYDPETSISSNGFEVEIWRLSNLSKTNSGNYTVTFRSNINSGTINLTASDTDTGMSMPYEG